MWCVHHKLGVSCRIIACGVELTKLWCVQCVCWWCDCVGLMVLFVVVCRVVDYALYNVWSVCGVLVGVSDMVWWCGCGVGECVNRVV